jgi:glycosyltransferase involved in cell wall biosynthesis
MQREAFFDRIDVLVQCSVIENLPYSIMEAMERGVPVIGTRVGGIPDLIEDGKTGWLVEPGDAGGLAEAMRDAVKMPGKRVAMGARAGKKLLDEFQPEVCIQRHMELYLESIP